MIIADSHLHTLFSHGANAPLEMAMAAKRKNLRFAGFSEHSPRPEGFNYKREYREQLKRGLPAYFRQVNGLRDRGEAALAMEIDWLEGQEDFARATKALADYDYVIGSVHFLGAWGFDDGDEGWRDASEAECHRRFDAYFDAWGAMIESGLFDIAAHPDLIKIFAAERFRAWLETPKNREKVLRRLRALKASGMAMEISSAGLRKACREIYPGPVITRMAADLKIPISMASDAHNVADVAYAFDELERYAKSFGYDGYVIYRRGKPEFTPF